MISRRTARLAFLLALAAIGFTVILVSQRFDRASAGGTLITVTNLDDPGNGVCDDNCTLREAINLANGSQGNTIAFNVPGCPPACTITLDAALPSLSQLLTSIDGTTQPGWVDVPLIKIQAGMTPPGSSGLTTMAEATTLKGLAITGFPDHGIDASNPSRQLLTLVGVRATGNGRDGLNASVLSTLTIIDSQFEGNFASGVYASNTTMEDAIFDSASASGNGWDGLNVAASGSLAISGSTFDANGQAGVYAAAATTDTVHITESAADQNGSNGIEVAAGTALSVMSSNFSENNASGLSAAASTVQNATLFGNVIGTNGSNGAYLAVSGTLNVTGNLMFANGDAGLNAGSAAASAGAVAQNGIANNGGSGVVLWGGGVRVHHNQIVGNALGVQKLGGEALDAEDNWWGCNAGPGQPGCDSTSGGVDADPWLVLTLTANPDSVPQNGTSELRADFDINSDGTDTSSDGHLNTPSQVLFTASAGLLDGTSLTPASIGTSKPIVDGIATAVYTADTPPGTVQVTAELDDEVVSLPITVTTPATPTPTTTATPTPTPTPTPTSTPSGTLSGDADCDGSVDSVDALWVLRDVAGMDTTAACLDAANVKCDDGLTSVDALFILRYVAHLPNNLGDCPPIGE